MALDSYTNLKTALQAWIARGDLSADVDDMIDMFEGWCNRNLRVPRMEQEATTTAAEYIALPVDFLELRDIQWQGNPRVQLEYVSPAMADIQDPIGTACIPRFYSIVGDQLRLIPPPNDLTTLIRIDYWQKIPALSGTNATNWLLSLYPDAYLFGPLTYGNVRIQDPQMTAFIQQGWTSVMNEIQNSGRNANLGSLLRVRVA